MSLTVSGSIMADSITELYQDASFALSYITCVLFQLKNQDSA